MYPSASMLVSLDPDLFHPPRVLSRPVSALKGVPAVQAEAAMAGRERLGKEER